MPSSLQHDTLQHVQTDDEITRESYSAIAEEGEPDEEQGSFVEDITDALGQNPLYQLLPY